MVMTAELALSDNFRILTTFVQRGLSGARTKRQVSCLRLIANRHTILEPLHLIFEFTRRSVSWCGLIGVSKCPGEDLPRCSLLSSIKELIIRKYIAHNPRHPRAVVLNLPNPVTL